MTALDRALDAFDGPGQVTVERGGHDATIDVLDADRLGVRIRGLRVRCEQPRDVVDEAAALPDRLRALPDRVRAVEVDPALGGASLRSIPEEMRGDYFEVDVRPHETEVRRTRVVDGERQPADFTLTREQLDRLIDQVAG
jgi:hypothetical protein